MISNALKDAVESSKGLSMWIGDRIDNTPLRTDLSVQCAGACFHISLTHHSSTPLLVSDGRHVSAFALLRPQVESYLVGLWLRCVASESNAAVAIKNNSFPGGRALMAKLEKAGHFDRNTISRLAGDMWPTLCDFAHTGSRAIMGHITGDAIESSFGDDEILEALRVANAFALLTGLGLASLADNRALEEQMIEEAERRASQIRTRLRFV